MHIPLPLNQGGEIEKQFMTRVNSFCGIDEFRQVLRFAIDA